ncbi:hypothetical protein [Mannheimia indoligenes]|uniref:hypothetical protein n=1 Tax=Mannheimia indoligenes TaxID=3103145 RepID=UPI002FE51BA7
MSDRIKAIRIDDQKTANINCYLLLNKCYKEIRKGLYARNYSISCKLYDFFSEDLHIAPACNVAESIGDIATFLESIGVNGEVKKKRRINKKITASHIKIYIFLLFNLYEQVKQFHSLLRKAYGPLKMKTFDFCINEPFEQDDGNNTQNEVVELVKSYANYYKHPKSMVTHAHHPEMWIANPDGFIITISSEDFTTQDFIKYYSNKLNDRDAIEMERKLDSEGIKVIFEDIVLLTRNLSEIIQRLLDYVMNNQTLLDYIKDNCSR